MGASCRRQRLTSLRSVCEDIRDTELCRDVDDLGGPVGGGLICLSATAGGWPGLGILSCSTPTSNRRAWAGGGQRHRARWVGSSKRVFHGPSRSGCMEPPCQDAQ